MPDSEIETIIRSRRIGYWHVGDILDRLFREEGVSGLKSIESIRLSDLSGFTTAWAFARNEAPIAATVGEHIKTAARMMWYEFRDAFDHVEPDERDRVSAIWLKSALRLPVLDLLVVNYGPDSSLELVSGGWEQSPVERPTKVEALVLEDGFTVKLQRLNSDGDTAESETLAFASFRARLFDPEDQPLSYVRVDIVRKRRRELRLSRQQFLFDMDVPDDELSRLGIRLMEVVSSPTELFKHGHLVVVQEIDTTPEHRRRGHARRLLLALLKDMRRRYRGLGTLVVPLFARSLLITPSEKAPPALRMLYVSATAPARQMFSDSRISEEALGPGGTTLCFDEGAFLNDVEMAFERLTPG